MNPISLLLLSLSACTPAPQTEPCGLSSTVPGYEPECSAVLALFGDEARLQIDGRLTAFLPPNVQADAPYGGLSGNPLSVLLDEELAVSRETTLTFGQDLLSARLLAVFDSGEVSGVVSPTVVDSQ